MNKFQFIDRWKHCEKNVTLSHRLGKYLNDILAIEKGRSLHQMAMISSEDDEFLWYLEADVTAHLKVNRLTGMYFTLIRINSSISSINKPPRRAREWFFWLYLYRYGERDVRSEKRIQYWQRAATMEGGGFGNGNYHFASSTTTTVDIMPWNGKFPYILANALMR